MACMYKKLLFAMIFSVTVCFPLYAGGQDAQMGFDLQGDTIVKNEIPLISEMNRVEISRNNLFALVEPAKAGQVSKEPDFYNMVNKWQVLQEKRKKGRYYRPGVTPPYVQTGATCLVFLGVSGGLAYGAYEFDKRWRTSNSWLTRRKILGNLVFLPYLATASSENDILFIKSILKSINKGAEDRVKSNNTGRILFTAFSALTGAVAFATGIISIVQYATSGAEFSADLKLFNDPNITLITPVSASAAVPLDLNSRYSFQNNPFDFNFGVRKCF
jgi:hypothetical protein